MVLVFSASSNSSEDVFKEVHNAIGEGIPVLPFRIDDAKPSGQMAYHLAGKHWLDAVTPPLESHISKLVGDVDRLLDRKRPEGPTDVETAPEASGPEDADEPAPPEPTRLMPMSDAIAHALKDTAGRTTSTGQSSRFDMRIEQQIREQARRDVAGSALHRRRLEEVIARRDAILFRGGTPEPYSSSSDLLREIHW